MFFGTASLQCLKTKQDIENCRRGRKPVEAFVLWKKSTLPDQGGRRAIFEPTTVQGMVSSKMKSTPQRSKDIEAPSGPLRRLVYGREDSGKEPLTGVGRQGRLSSSSTHAVRIEGSTSSSKPKGKK